MPVSKEHCQLCLLQYLGANVNKAAMSTVRLAAKWSASSPQSRSNWTARSSIGQSIHLSTHILSFWTASSGRAHVSAGRLANLNLFQKKNDDSMRPKTNVTSAGAKINCRLQRMPLFWTEEPPPRLVCLCWQCYIVDFAVALIGIRFITGKDKHLHLCIVYPMEDGGINVIKPLERATGSIDYRYLACNHQSVR